MDAETVVTDVTAATAIGRYSTYNTGEIINIYTMFSEAVAVTGTPTLSLETGSTGTQASYISGSGSRLLTFAYTVVIDDFATDLDYVSSTALELNGGTIAATTTPNRAAVLTLPEPGTRGSLSSNKNIAINPTEAIPLNTAPRLTTPIETQELTVNTTFTVTIPAGTFIDDQNDPLMYSSVTLPRWLSIDADTGTFAGTPPVTEPNLTTYTFLVSDGTTSTNSMIGITVNAAPTLPLPVIKDKIYLIDRDVSETLPLVTTGTGTKPIKYTLSPVLPDDLMFNSGGQRRITGTVSLSVPEQTTTYTYTAEDRNGALTAQEFTIETRNPLVFQRDISNNIYPYITGSTINETLPEATGGIGDITYGLLPELPTGLTFNTDGQRRITGTAPTLAQRLDYTYTARAGSEEQSQTFTIDIRNPIALPSISTKIFIIGREINIPPLPEATGGIIPITYKLVPPTLPDGLTFNDAPDSREITGTVSLSESSQTLTYDYVAQDQTGTQTTQTFTIEIRDPLTLQNISDKTYFFGNSVTDPLPAADGGLGTITYTLEPALPNPLSFSTATRIISGTVPGTKQEARYDYTAQDETGMRSIQTFTITISSTPIPIGLNVQPSPLNIIVGMNGQLTVDVAVTSEDTDVTLTVTVDSRGENIITGLAEEYLLSGEASTQITMRGAVIGDTTLTITAAAEDYITETTLVSVVVLDTLRVEAEPTIFTLTEDESTQINVSLTRIEASDVTVNIEATGGLGVSPLSLTFDGRESKAVTVTATNANDYIGDRSATLILTADGYTTAMVTVNIIEDTPQPIELRVRGSTDLSLVRFTSTIIEVSVEVDATLNVETEGAVRLEDAQSEYNLTGGADATQIQIRGDSVGDGTVTFMVSGDRKATDTVVVSVTVTRPTLVINASADELVIEARTTKELTVRVSAVGGHNSTLTATVSDEASGVASVTPMKIANDVVADTMVMFTVEGLAAGNTTTHANGQSSILQAGEYDGCCEGISARSWIKYDSNIIAV